MSKKFKPKVTLFFLEGSAATEAEMEASREFEPGVQFRNAHFVADTGALEYFDRLAGAIPARYQAAQDAKPGATPPVGGQDGQDGPPAPQTPPGAPGAPVVVKPPVAKPGVGWSGNA